MMYNKTKKNQKKFHFFLKKKHYLKFKKIERCEKNIIEHQLNYNRILFEK